jgi:Uma2 family endonuclease
VIGTADAEAISGGDDMVALMLDLEQLSPERVRPLHRREYEQLIEAGAFEDERVELLRGVLVEMSPQSEDHVVSCARIARMLNRALGDELEVRTHASHAAGEDSMPEPDVVVVAAEPWGTPPSRTFLVVEVSHTSLRKDRRVKTSIYAEAGFPEYWIVDLAGRAVEVYTQPRDGEYQRMVRIGDDGVLRPAAFPEVAIPVAEIVPPR